MRRGDPSAVIDWLPSFSFSRLIGLYVLPATIDAPSSPIHLSCTTCMLYRECIIHFLPHRERQNSPSCTMRNCQSSATVSIQNTPKEQIIFASRLRHCRTTSPCYHRILRNIYACTSRAASRRRAKKGVDSTVSDKVKVWMLRPAALGHRLLDATPEDQHQHRH